MRRATCHPDRKHFAKGLCQHCWETQYRKARLELCSLQAKRWRTAHPEKSRLWAKNGALKRRYGLDLGKLEAMRRFQDNACAVCGATKVKRLCVDHNHKTNRVRGLVCGGCNNLIGYIETKPTRIMNVLRYLRWYGDLSEEFLLRVRDFIDLFDIDYEALGFIRYLGNDDPV